MANSRRLLLIDAKLTHHVIVYHRIPWLIAFSGIVLLCISPGCNCVFRQPLKLVLLDKHVPVSARQEDCVAIESFE